MTSSTDKKKPIEIVDGQCTLDAEGVYYRQLNEQIREAFAAGAETITLQNVNGHRYIGCAIGPGGKIIINGTPGNDLASFMNGVEIVVNANAQDGVANTMNEGKITIHGDAGDVLAHSMRGGTLLVRGGVGYRAGIHMKSYEDKRPVVVIGGPGGDYLGEYMAGGLLIVLGLGRDEGEPISGIYTGTGMHGGKMLLADDIEDYRLGKEVGKSELDDEDRAELHQYVGEYVEAFGGNLDELLAKPFVKLAPFSRRPYGQIYVY
jgi:glutamate synthase domain-containing protein 3